MSSSSSSEPVPMSNSNNSSSSGGSGGGKCPVDHQSSSVSLWSVLGVRKGGGEAPPSTHPLPTTTETPPVPVEVATTTRATAAAAVASLEEAAKHAQIPHPTQRLPLSTHRVESSIPRGTLVSSSSSTNSSSDIPSQSLPHHQWGTESSSTTNKNNHPHWVYPSEQQVFNAMKRKGWEGIEEESIPSFLHIHNSVNERGWRLVQEWESTTSTTVSSSPLQLVRFEGRPKELSPKAWIWSKLLFQDPPFDRHDWYVDNGVDKEKRYILDFYMTNAAAAAEADSTRAAGGGGLPRVDIDVRPALDTPSAVFERAQRGLMDLFPGITKELQRLRSSPSSSTPAEGR